MFDITNAVVAITGASSGIGAATARLLAQRGARVVLGARRTDRLLSLVEAIRARGGIAHAIALDVTRRDDVEAFVAHAVELHGRIDAMVNNAGVMLLSRLEALRVEEWERTLDVNVKGVLYGIAACLPRMQAQRRGHIVNIASIGAHRAYPGAAAYCASKFAVWAISEALRLEHLDGELRVTTVSPGTTESELAEHITDPAAAAAMKLFRATTIDAEAIACAVLYALEQPADVSVSELVVRPTRSPD
jgi:NADP-dependent 3-hydroxy acid dehydrogenase YdfG